MSGFSVYDTWGICGRTGGAETEIMRGGREERERERDK